MRGELIAVAFSLLTAVATAVSDGGDTAPTVERRRAYKETVAFELPEMTTGAKGNESIGMTCGAFGVAVSIGRSLSTFDETGAPSVDYRPYYAESDDDSRVVSRDGLTLAAGQRGDGARPSRVVVKTRPFDARGRELTAPVRSPPEEAHSRHPFGTYLSLSDDGSVLVISGGGDDELDASPQTITFYVYALVNDAWTLRDAITGGCGGKGAAAFQLSADGDTFAGFFFETFRVYDLAPLRKAQNATYDIPDGLLASVKDRGSIAVVSVSDDGAVVLVASPAVCAVWIYKKSYASGAYEAHGDIIAYDDEVGREDLGCATATFSIDMNPAGTVFVIAAEHGHATGLLAFHAPLPNSDHTNWRRIPFKGEIAPNFHHRLAFEPKLVPNVIQRPGGSTTGGVCVFADANFAVLSAASGGGLILHIHELV